MVPWTGAREHPQQPLTRTSKPGPSEIKHQPTTAGSALSSGLSRTSGDIGGDHCLVRDSANQFPCPQPNVIQSFPDDPTHDG
jgi:hypothetical protein